MRSRSPAEQQRRPRTPSPVSRSTPSGCGRTSRRAAASSSRSASRSPSALASGRGQAHEVVAEAARAPSFREALLADQRTGLSTDELDALLDPTGYLGAAEALVDRALGEYERTRA